MVSAEKQGDSVMMYPLMTLDDGMEIVYSDVRDDGSVKVYMEKPDEKDGFHFATCYLPSYRWENVSGLSEKELSRCRETIEASAERIYASCKNTGEHCR